MKNRRNSKITDVELLAAVLSVNAQGQAAAIQLLHRFDGLRALLHASNADLLDCAGIGHARLAALRALPEVARRYFDESLPCGETIRSPADTELFLKARMQHLDHELFCCLYLDLCVALINVELGRRDSIAAWFRRRQLHINALRSAAST